MNPYNLTQAERDAVVAVLAKSFRAFMESDHAEEIDPDPTPSATDAAPGMETSTIKSLENAAYELADIREQIVDLRTQIAAAKHRIVKALHTAGKTAYRRNGIAVELVAGSEDVKIRIVKQARPDVDDVALEPLPARKPDLFPA